MNKLTLSITARPVLIIEISNSCDEVIISSKIEKQKAGLISIYEENSIQIKTTMHEDKIVMEYFNLPVSNEYDIKIYDADNHVLSTCTFRSTAPIEAAIS